MHAFDKALERVRCPVQRGLLPFGKCLIRGAQKLELLAGTLLSGSGFIDGRSSGMKGVQGILGVGIRTRLQEVPRAPRIAVQGSADQQRGSMIGTSFLGQLEC